MIVECTKLSVVLGDLAALLTISEIKAGSFRYHLRVVQEHMVRLLYLNCHSLMSTVIMFS